MSNDEFTKEELIDLKASLTESLEKLKELQKEQEEIISQIDEL